jgi:maleylpyruvate isomerase
VSASTVRRAHARAKGINGTVGGVTADPLALLAEVDRATRRVLATAAGLGDPAARSLLPGWSQGHVLTHLARNADGMVNLLAWARTGVVTPAYAGPQARAADIEAGARRPLAELTADVRDSAARFAEAAAAVPAAAWSVEVVMPTGPTLAALIPWRRLREVEVHHADLGAAYTPADWPDSFAHRLLREVVGDLKDVPLVPRPAAPGEPVTVAVADGPTVTGPAYALAAWLAGRSAGEGLTVDPAGPLPAVPDWI